MTDVLHAPVPVGDAAPAAPVRRRPRSMAGKAAPWLWLTPLLLLSSLVLLFPLVETVVLSFRRADGTGWAGAGNYAWSFGSAIRLVLLNNVVWLVAYPLATVALGVIVAVLLNKVRYERFARTIIVIPTAISFTAAAVTWRLMYAYQPPGQPQTGTVNAFLSLFPGFTPVAWLSNHTFDNMALILVAVWTGLGVAVLVLSAAVKAVDGEMLEAARLDGCGEWRLFVRMILPSIGRTVLTVATTQIIFALKIFDIVYVMTNGNSGTDVVGNRMYAELFQSSNFGHASALAVILLVAALPILWFTVRIERREAHR